MQETKLRIDEYDTLLEQQADSISGLDSCIFYEESTGITYYGAGAYYDPHENIFHFMKPLTEPHLIGPYELNNFLTEFWMRKNYTRFFYPLLRPKERIVFDFILDRTIGWGKTEEWIRKATFVKGLINYTGGTGLAEPTINEAIRNLVQADLIVKWENQYGIDFSVVNQFIIKKRKGIMYPIPAIK